MNNIIEYKVILESDYTAFETNMNEALSEGWEPVGGVTMVWGGTFAQAVIKNEDPKEYDDD